MTLVIKFEAGLKPVFKHQEHDQSTHGSWANGEGGVENGFMRLAPQFDNFEDFSRAVSLDGLRPRQWHIAGDDFKLDSLRKPTDRTGSTTQEAGLFVGEPKIWEDYAVGREVVVEYDLSGLTYTSKPFSDTKADFFSDQSGNQGFFIRPSGFAKLKEVGRFSISEAKQRADKQSKQMLKSKEEARILWERAKEKLVQKHESHDQSTHGSWANGGGGSEGVRDLIANGTIERGNKLDDQLDLITGEHTPQEFLDGIRTEDLALKQIVKLQGFDAKPQTSDDWDEFNAIKQPKMSNGEVAGSPMLPEVSRLSRGFGEGVSLDGVATSGAEAISQFKNGEYWAGKGSYGNGIYSSPDMSIAMMYTSGSNTQSSIIQFKLSSDSKVGSYSALMKEMLATRDSSGLPASLHNIGRYAAAKGYDAYLVDVLEQGRPQVVVLNRGKVILSPEHSSGEAFEP
jgi:hypothetical protein